MYTSILSFYIIIVLFALSIQFLIFEHSYLESTRHFILDKISYIPVVGKLVNDMFSCSYCSGFWTGLTVALFVGNTIQDMIFISFITAFVSYKIK